MSSITTEELLKLGIASGIITEEQVALLKMTALKQLSQKQMAIINILHDTYCPLHHDKECMYHQEAQRTECWDMPAHLIWKRAYTQFIDEHQPTSDQELLGFMQKANELIGSVHQTIQWLIAYECMGFPKEFFEDEEEELPKTSHFILESADRPE